MQETTRLTRSERALVVLVHAIEFGIGASALVLFWMWMVRP